MQSPELFAALSQRALMDQQFATQISESILPFLNKLARYVRERLSREGERIESQERLDKIVADVRKRSETAYNGVISQTFAELYDLAEDEAGFTTEAFQAVLVAGITVKAISSALARRSVNENPLIIDKNSQARDFRAYIREISGFNEEITSAIIGGYHQGSTVQQITQSIVGSRAQQFQDGLIDGSRRSIARTVRTAATHISTQSRLAVFEANPDITYAYRIVATIDSRTSAICRGYDQRVVRYDAKFKPKPPFHYNCVLPDTNIATCGNVLNVFKRAYKGAIVDIVTRSGKTLSITPNHPILTNRGWLSAKLVNAGDKLATITDSHIVVNNKEDSVISKASDLFAACDISSDSRLIANAPTAPKDFHGDVTDAEVSIIKTDGLTWGRVKSILDKKVKNPSFVSRIKSALLRFGAFDFLGIAHNSTFSGFISRFNKGFFSGFVSSIHSSLLLFRPISNVAELRLNQPLNGGFATANTDMFSDASNSNTAFVSIDNRGLLGLAKGDDPAVRAFNASAFKDSVEAGAANAEELANIVGSHSIDGVELDDVVDVSTREYAGHVYNLENKNNWYVSNGIITHNCRTVIAPEIYGRSLQDTGATRAVAFKGGTVGQVSAQKQYYDILKNQPADIQDAVLGKARGLIFRNSGLSAEEFRKALTDTMGNPLTLAEMAQKNETILNYMRKNSFLDGYLPGG